MVDNANLRGMAQIGCDATTIGVVDLYTGGAYYLDRIAEAGLTVVSANVRDEATGDLLVDPYVVVERGGIKFGITGVLSPDLKITIDTDLESHGAVVGDPIEALRKYIPEIREQVDFVVVLSHSGLTRSKDIASEVEGIDIMVVGNHNAYAAQPYEVGETLMMQPGYKGQIMCDYRLSFDADGAYESYSGRAVVLDNKVPADAAMALVLKEHKLMVEAASKRRAADQAAERRFRRDARNAAAAELYKEECIGVSQSCNRCHQDKYDHWQTTAHASAFETLEKSLQSTNPECLSCHTTGQKDLPDDGSREVPAHLRGVQCESCHGIGAEHSRDGSYGRVTVATCLQCHDSENSPDFNFARYLAEVTH
jgi:hypothetical protein